LTLTPKSIKMAHVNRLNNARVLVFGGTSGIGFGVANMALSNSAYVTISGSTQAKVDSKIALLKSYYPSLPAEKLNGYAVDLADNANLEKNLEELFEKVTEGGTKKIDHIAFTAGDVPIYPKLSEVTVADLERRSTIRSHGAIMIAKLLLKDRYMPTSYHSSFTITGGVSTKKPIPGRSLLTGLGGQLEALARGLAVDLKPIRVNFAEPGAIDTELLRAFINSSKEVDLEKAFKEMTLTGTLGQPSDTAEAFRWFMVDRFVTGGVASTNGGRLLAGL
jgi:NAD(P)-dependent dehydrogenase (short-subunit alcohol dehydrogenase family)